MPAVDWFAPVDIEPPLVGSATRIAEGSRSLALLADVFHRLLAEESLESLLAGIADSLSMLLPYDTLTIYAAEPDGELVPVLARDAWAEEIMQTRIPFGRGITGWAVAERQAVLVNEAQLDPRRAVVPGTPADEPEALICVPLLARGRLCGALNCYRVGEGASFGADDFELVQRFADAAALALDNARTRAELEGLARSDPLTGLANRRAFDERLVAELATVSRLGVPVTLLMMDIDDFKRINDTYGHPAGDAALRCFAGVVAETIRAGDVAARLGGEEFAILMPACEAAEAQAVFERLQELLRATSCLPDEGIAVSAGIAEAPLHTATAGGLVERADRALRAAKRQGKNRAVVFGFPAQRHPLLSGAFLPP
jgi:diguanylate cyclase (GGDEF)-like protein